MSTPTPNMIDLLASAENALSSSQSLEAGLADKKAAVLELETALAAARKDLDATSAQASDAGKAFKDVVASIVALRPELTVESVEGMISTRLMLLGGIAAPVAPAPSKEQPASKKPETPAKAVEPAKQEPPATKPANPVVEPPKEASKPEIVETPKADPEPDSVEIRPDAQDQSVATDPDASQSQDEVVTEAEEDADVVEEQAQDDEVGFDPMALTEDEPTEVWGEDEDGEDASQAGVEETKPEIVEEKTSAGKTPGSRSNRPAPAAAKPIDAKAAASAPTAQPAEEPAAPVQEKTDVADEVVVESISNSDLPDFLSDA